MTTTLTLVRFSSPSGEDRYSLGHPLLDRYLEFVAGRARPNTLRAAAFDLKTFFSVIDKDPADVVATDVFDFLAQQRGDRKVVRMADRESGVSATGRCSSTRARAATSASCQWRTRSLPPSATTCGRSGPKTPARTGSSSC